MRQFVATEQVMVTALQHGVLQLGADGHWYPVSVGDILAKGTVLRAEALADVSLAPADEPADEGRESTPPGDYLVEQQGEAPAPNAQPGGDLPADVAALQQAILQGVDPTQNFEATAAGGAGAGVAGAAGSGNGGFVEVTRTGDQTIATAGYDSTVNPTAALLSVPDAAAEQLTGDAPNQPPTAADLSLTTAEDTAVSGVISASDLDGDSLSFTVGTAPANGSVTLNADGSFTYTPAANYHGSDSFTVLIDDGNGGTTSSTVSIGVTPVNDAPTSADQSLTTAEDTAVSGAISASDLDGDSLSFTVDTAPANGSVTLNADGSFTYTPAANYHGNDSFTVLIDDGNGGTTSSTVSIGVTPVNDAPTTADVNLTTAEDTAVSGVISASDLDGDSLSYAVSSEASHGSVILNADGSFTYTPAANYHGSDSFSVLIDDGNGGTTSSTVSIGVTPVNDAPTSADQSLITAEDTAVSGAISASDLDGDSLSYTVSSEASHGSVTLNADGSFTYTPAANYHGSDSFTVLIDDGNGGTTSSTVS
ncbi:retention module-containing protein, partial [Pseudaeromonas paramecii]|uniref:retention module-containing protein n=1 Tax=Pseudaeromonas paramecii TaxID=2138166 RepID=UPI0031F0C0C5